MFNIAVLVSGGGTNLQSIIDKIKENFFIEKVSIKAVIADRKCYSLERAQKEGIQNFLLDKKLYKNNFFKQIDEILTDNNVELVVLAGFLSILSEKFVKKWDKRIINIHPSLLPKFGGSGMYGLNVHKAVIDNNEKESGATVHYVTSQIDCGEIIKQKKVKILKDDTPEILQKRVLVEEHMLLPEAINIVIKRIRDKKMKILIIGNGGREHAIALKISENKDVKKIYCAPGNAGTKIIKNCENINLTKIEELTKFSIKNNIDLVIVGSEELLVAGIVDEFKKIGIDIIGPNKKAAVLEGSKAFAKNFMKKYGIKTAKYEIFEDPNLAKKYIKSCCFPLVIKASGLAQGKGVIIAKNTNEALKTIDDLMIENIFNEAGHKIVIEEFLEGKEASILSITDSKTIIPFISAKDHKKIGENETGLNTGGMGAIAPNPYVTEEIYDEFYKDILIPTLTGIKNEKMDFSGFIFFGLMLTKKGVYLLEYNMRLGDPETQVVLPLLENDFLDVIMLAINKKLEDLKLNWKNKSACTVVLASKGYPVKYQKGFEILGTEDIDKNNSMVIFAGTKLENNKLVTSGGRVLNVVGLGENLEDAREIAYKNVEKIKFKGKYYRKDIGKI